MNLLRLKPRILKTSSNRPEEIAVHLKLLSRNVIIETRSASRSCSSSATWVSRRRHATFSRTGRFLSAGIGAFSKGAESARRIRPRLIWAAIGVVALGAALARRRRRIVATVIAVGALGYAIHTADTIVSIDAYPATYNRPAVTYQSISVANGMHFIKTAAASLAMVQAVTAMDRQRKNLIRNPSISRRPMPMRTPPAIFSGG